ncbi:hypothetical protein [Corynebacterium sp. TAE3-ERU16]|uniref:hypothetical protein n=1 Tax=Corynebacterium sp. TAE3-ERU16 TaxID=2849493 RepID=UPI001C490C4A|nr:hypothetical protein [Corynebacterium sp. TAE3-ERU16]MBV7292674.1 hypothetical protein [Corynebacterium sp. TAE3-ERU16]
MSVVHDLPTPSFLIPVIGGVAAFDPVTLGTAARGLSEKGLHVHLPVELDRGIPADLAALAVITFSPPDGFPVSVTATIDTGRLAWDLSEPAEPRDFTDYRDAERYGVAIGEHSVVDVDGTPVVSVHMRLPSGTSVNVWFAECPAETENIDAFGLLHRVDHLVSGYSRGEGKMFDRVVVPALDFTYATEAGGARVEEWEETTVLQRFAAALNEDGARVIAETTMCTGAPPNIDQLPSEYVFGARGPILTWFTQPGNPMPFSIIWSSSDGWSDPDGEIDLDQVELPVP